MSKMNYKACFSHGYNFASLDSDYSDFSLTTKCFIIILYDFRTRMAMVLEEDLAVAPAVLAGAPSSTHRR